MLNGKEKATLLFTLLGDKGKEILGYLSQETVSELSHLLEECPEKNTENITAVLDEVKKKFKPQKIAQAPAITETIPPIDYSLAKSTGIPSSLFGSDEEEEKPAPAPVLKPGDIRPLGKIAKILGQQKPQIIAFILSKIDEAQKEEILNHLSPELQEKVNASNIAKTPLSENIFKKIYQDIFICTEKDFEEPEEEPIPEDKPEETLEPLGSSLGGFGSLEADSEEKTSSLFSMTEAEPTSMNFGGFEENSFSFGDSAFSFNIDENKENKEEKGSLFQ